MKDLRETITTEEHNERMDAARRRAQWELGDPSWAAVIVQAYLYPEEDKKALEAEIA